MPAADPPAAEDTLDAGELGEWLAGLQAALRAERDSDVPCGSCTACCTGSQFVHIGPDEVDTLAHVPAPLRFPAPGLPPGHVLLGYDERGHCPMLVAGACSIYEHRPRTCRTYDCRVFAASGVAADEGDATKALIQDRAARWRFTYETEADRVRHDAVRRAAAHLAAHRSDLPGLVPASPTALAVLAVEVHGRYLHDGEVHDPPLEAVRVELRRVQGARRV